MREDNNFRSKTLHRGPGTNLLEGEKGERAKE